MRVDDRRKLLSTFVLMCVALTAVYWNHFDNAFHFDDMHTIVNNQYITDISNVPKFFIDAKTTSSLPTNQAYRPAITTLNAVDYWLGGGLKPEIYHWHIYIEFLLLLIVLFFVLTTLFRASTQNSHAMLAIFACSIFGFHTATAETLNYIIARSDGFSTLMVLLGMLIFIRMDGWKKQLGLLPFAVGCLAKPTTLMLAPLLAVYTLLFDRPSLTVRDDFDGLSRPLLRAFRTTAAYFLIGVLLYVFTRSMFSETWTPGGSVPALEYLKTQAWVIWIYIRTFFLPMGLTADTDLTTIPDLLDARVIWGISVIAAMILIAVLASLKRTTLPVAFGISWFFIALIPSSSVVPLAEVMNHHRTFFPYIGLVIAFSWALFLAARRIRVTNGNTHSALITILALCFLGAHAWGTWQRNEVWDNSESLWRDVTLKSPRNGRGLMNYGLALMAKGNMDGAIEYYQKALKTSYGSHPYLYINLGIAFGHKARTEGDDSLSSRAEWYFREAIRKGPRYSQPYYRFARWLLTEGRSIEALSYVDRAIALSPANKDALALREQIIGSGEYEDSGAEVAAGHEPTRETFLDLSMLYFEQGRYDKSIEASRAAIRLDPNYALAWNNLCSAYNKLGQFKDAIDACEKAIDIDPGFERARNNLRFAKNRLTSESG